MSVCFPVFALGPFWGFRNSSDISLCLVSPTHSGNSVGPSQRSLSRTLLLFHVVHRPAAWACWALGRNADVWGHLRLTESESAFQQLLEISVTAPSVVRLAQLTPGDSRVASPQPMPPGAVAPSLSEPPCSDAHPPPGSFSQGHFELQFPLYCSVIPIFAAL